MPTKTLLIIDGSNADYISLFKQVKTIKFNNERGEEEEEPLEVDQAAWEDINLSAYSDTGVVVDIRPSKNPSRSSKQVVSRYDLIHFFLISNRTCKPNFVLIRNAARGINGQDYRNLLFGFAYANIPTLNSLESVIWNLGIT